MSPSKIESLIGLFALFPFVMLAFAIAVLALWLAGLVHCLLNRHDKDRLVWVLVTLLGGPIGAAIYFAIGRKITPPPLATAPAHSAAAQDGDAAFFDHHGMQDARKRAAEISEALWRSGKPR